MRALLLFPALATALSLAGCAPADEAAGGGASSASATTSASAGESASPTETAEACAKDALKTRKPGTLTIGTDKPAYEPWFVDNDPTNGKGYESAVAYAVADRLGFTDDQVTSSVVKPSSSATAAATAPS